MVSLHETFTDHKVQVLINNSRIQCTRSRSLGVSRMINVDLNFSKEISFAESWNSWGIYFSQHRTLRTSAEFGSSRTGENDVACFFFGILFDLSGQRRVRLPAVIITVSPGSLLSVSITSMRWVSRLPNPKMPPTFAGAHCVAFGPSTNRTPSSVAVGPFFRKVANGRNWNPLSC